MINLVVDIGNSSTKIAVFNQDERIFSDQSPVLAIDSILQLKERYGVENLIICSVKEDIFLDEAHLKRDFNYIRFGRTTAIPINNKYQSPETLGLDRLAAVIGAYHLFPEQQIMVLDAGTCITYDVLNEKAEYHGGSISPGIKMRFEAMYHFTAKLPLVQFSGNYHATYGENSEDAIKSGAINGVSYEAEGFINSQLKSNPNTKIILCGGDAAFFDTRFKNSIFAHLILHEPHLVLIGLNTVVNHQHDIK